MNVNRTDKTEQIKEQTQLCVKRKKKEMNNIKQINEQTQQCEKRKEKEKNNIGKISEQKQQCEKTKEKEINNTEKISEQTQQSQKRKEKEKNNIEKISEQTQQCEKRNEKEKKYIEKISEQTQQCEKRKENEKNNIEKISEQTQQCEKTKEKEINNIEKISEQKQQCEKRKEKEINNIEKISEQTQQCEKTKEKEINNIEKIREQKQQCEKRKEKEINNIEKISEQTQQYEKRKEKEKNNIEKISEQTQQCEKTKEKEINNIEKISEQKQQCEERKEKEINNIEKNKRTDTAEREKEREGDKQYRKNTRADTTEREKEKECDRRKRKREDSEVRRKTNEIETPARKKKRLHLSARETSIEQNISEFCKKVKEGPVYICCSCQKLLYKRSVILFKRHNFSSCDEDILHTCTNSKTSADSHVYICSTCARYLKKNTIPPQSIGNNLRLDELPEELQDLSSLEVTLISKRVPFMKILGLPRGRQKAVHGCVVNVPVNPDETCGVLPRLPSSASITVKLKPKLKYRGHVMKQTIRPWRILCALYYLKYTRKNPHYDDITVNEYWQEMSELEDNNLWQSLTNQDTVNEENTNLPTSEDQSEETNESQKEDMHTNQETCNEENNNPSTSEDQGDGTNESEMEDVSDVDDDNTHNKLSGLPYDTCIQPKDITSDPDFLLSLAPGEGKRPLSIHTDKHNEEMSFPQLFPSGIGGLDSERPKKLTIKQYFKSRILNCDNRFSSSIEYLFYAQYRTEAKEVNDCMSIAIRKCKGDVQCNKITAGRVKEAQKLRQLTRNDLSYHFLQKIRGSPAYYNKMLYDMMGMIRQLGPCTWFLTLSAADMKWTDTIQVIGAQNGETFTEEDINNMTWEQKAFWLRTNPVTAARHFDHRLQLLMYTLICGKSNPIGKVQDYKYRIEFQQRGSPHAHMVVWIRDAPKISEESRVIAQDFIKQYIACRLPNDDVELRNLVETVQKHSHSSYCRKSGSNCRFGFPRPPMESTAVVLPPDQPVTSKKDYYEDISHAVHAAVHDIKTDSTLQLETILEKISVSPENYVEALTYVKTAKGQPAILLERTPAECFINNYNEHLLTAWGANMDIQFITNVYACLMYVASYMSKPEKTLGDMLKSVSETCEPQGPKAKMQTISKKFLSHREVSAQEAVFRLLSLPLSSSSREVVFIPTNFPEDRTYLLKPMKDIQQLDDDDEDLLMKSMPEKYQERPLKLEDICMGEFFSCYKSGYSQKAKKHDGNDDADDAAVGDDDDGDNDVETGDRHSIVHDSRKENLPKNIELHSGQKMTLRKTPAIIRTHQFNKDKNEEQYFHAKLMLYLPWRNEEDLKHTDGTYKSKFIEWFNVIQDNMQVFNRMQKKSEERKKICRRTDRRKMLGHN